jgi:hypothetical protein
MMVSVEISGNKRAVPVEQRAGTYSARFDRYPW